MSQPSTVDIAKEAAQGSVQELITADEIKLEQLKTELAAAEQTYRTNSKEYRLMAAAEEKARNTHQEYTRLLEAVAEQKEILRQRREILKGIGKVKLPGSSACVA